MYHRGQMADDTWRYAEPDGKQRALSLDDLQRSLAKGLLPTNVPVWRAGFADWTPASDVPELRASVSSGARIIPPKGSQRPGRPVAQRGGAAATGEEPLSPPSYAPARKARPAAPALNLDKPNKDKPASETEMRGRASTLLIAGGAPAVDRNPESEQAPINVPTPGGANEAPNTITRPPPVSDGAAAVVPAIPPSSGKLTAAAVDDQAETREMPAAQRATLREEAWDIPDESAPALAVSSAMLLPDTGSIPEVVSTSMLLPSDDSSGTLPTTTIEAFPASDASPDSADVIPDSDVISTREPAVKRPTTPPPLRGSRPSYASNPSVRPPSRPSFPSRSEVLSQTPPPASTRDVAERIGLKSKPPPPDINPLSSDFPPPPGVPAEALEDEKTSPSLRRRAEQTKTESGEQKPVVPLWGAIAAVVAVGGGVWFLMKDNGEPAGGGTPTPTVSVAPSVTPVASTSPTVDAGAATAAKEAVACRLTSSARPIVQNVLQPAGIEVTMSGSRIAVGFAKSAREAAAVELDPASLATKTTVTAKAGGTITRVVPHFDGEQLAALPEWGYMTKGVSLQRRAEDVALGVAKNKLVRVAAEGTPEELFTLPAADVDALRVAHIPASQTDAAYTYRAPGSIWLGTTQKNDSPQRIPGLGPQVGSPTIAALDAKTFLSAWADRASETDKWALRIAAYTPGKGNVTPKPFGPKNKDSAMLSPALVRVDAGHALLLWTAEKVNGDTTTFEVDAQTLDAKGSPIGESFVVSAADMNGGQPQGVIGADGRGTVAFLVLNDGVYDLAVAGVDCSK